MKQIFLEELKISSSYIGIIFAVLNIVSAIASRKQNLFQNKFKNKTLTILGIVLTTSIIFSGLIAISKLPIVLVITIIIIMYIAKYISVGLYNVLLIKYLSNFTNSKIDTKIFAINSFITSIMSVLFGIYASKLISIMNTANSMIIFGLTSLVTITVVLIYMKNKVGLNPKKYSKLELQYDMKKW